MILDPKAVAIKKATDAIQASVAKQLAAILPKIIEQAFDAGSLEYATALGRAMNAVSIPGIAVPEPKPIAIPEGSLGEAGKEGRAPRGSIRKAVVAALGRHPQGFTSAEVVVRAVEIDPSISSGGIHNELNRQKGKLYLNVDGRWRLMPGLRLGGDFYELPNLNPEKDEATEPSEA